MSLQTKVRKHRPPLNGRPRPRSGKPHIFLQDGFWRVFPTSNRWHKNGKRSKAVVRMNTACQFAAKLNHKIFDGHRIPFTGKVITC